MRAEASRVLNPLPGCRGHGRALVVFPHAGGSPRFFRHWVGQIPGVRLLGVTYPGRDHRIGDPHPTDIGALADEITDAIVVSGVGTPEPVLFGHSMGALIAHEVARRLVDRGCFPTLVVSGHDAPGAAPGVCADVLHRRPDQDLVADLVRLDQRNSEIFAQPELAELFLPAVREDYRMVETYRPPGRTCRLPRVLVVNGDADPEVTPAGAEAWGEHAEHFDGVRLLPGNHFHHAAPDRDCHRVLREYLTDTLVPTERRP